MNEKLKKIRDELATEFMKCPHTGVDAQYCLCCTRDEDSHKEGFTAAEPHIRQDERERVLNLMKDKCRYVTNEEEFYFRISSQWLEAELKKMDEANND